MEKVTIKLYKGDYRWLQDMYGTRIGGAKIIRTLVRTHRRNVESRVEQKSEPTAPIELNIEDLIDG